MSKKITVTELTDVIKEELEGYRQLAVEEITEAVKDAGETVRKEIEANAAQNFKGNKYAKSWVSKVTAQTALGVEVTVYSPKHYRIAHLLEHGHAKRGGGRVEGKPHIAPAEEAGEKKLEEDLKKALGG